MKNKTEDQYSQFLVDSLSGLIAYAKNPKSKETHGDLIAKYEKEIESDEWKTLVQFFLTHFQGVLESDRFDQLSYARKQKQKNEEEKKKAESEKESKKSETA